MEHSTMPIPLMLNIIISTVSLCMQYSFLQLVVHGWADLLLIIGSIISRSHFLNTGQPIKWWSLCSFYVDIESLHSLQIKIYFSFKKIKSFYFKKEILQHKACVVKQEDLKTIKSISPQISVKPLTYFKPKLSLCS